MAEEDIELFPFRLITPDGTLYQSEVSSVVAEGVSGQFELYPRHEPMLSPLKVAILAVYPATSDGSTPAAMTFAVHGGFLDMNGQEAIVFANAAEAAASIDLERAKEAEHRAKERLAAVTRNEGEPVPIDLDRAQLALMRAMLRIQAAQSPALKDD